LIPRDRNPAPGLRRLLILLAAVCAGPAGCAPSAAAGLPAGALPDSNAVSGWTAAGKVQTYNRETLFDYMDGSSEYFFTYSFEELAVQRYSNPEKAVVNVEVWRLADSADAFGLFSGRPDVPAVSLGGAAGAALETGSRLMFWQDRFYVAVVALDTVPDADLRGFGEFISARLPSGGTPPALIRGLPTDGLVAGSPKYFHQELAIQDKLWLGGENLLGLGSGTDCAYAEYRSAGADWRLLLVDYPDAAAAQSALEILRQGAVEDVSAADAIDAHLGAVFGSGDPSAADGLLRSALG
jgi:hypothetical protein